MAKISFLRLRQRAKSLGFDLSRTEAGVYQITRIGEYGCAMDGTFDDIRIWMLGLEWERQNTLHNFHLLRK